MSINFALNQMVKQQVRTWDVLDPRVLAVMTKIPRQHFVPTSYRSVAYADFCIPLNTGRQMFSPKVIGRILQALNLQSTDTVLECGTGSGYLSACMAALASRVVSLDADAEFIVHAAQIAADLGLNNVQFEQSDDYLPSGDRQFDAIVVNGSMPGYVSHYQQMLNTGGRLVVFIGVSPVIEAQLVTRVSEGQFTFESLFETDIPPLRGQTTPMKFNF